jgi:para-nitrobenzyl esterase
MTPRTTALATILAMAMTAPVHAQGARYKDNVFAGATLTSNIEYGSAKNYAGATEKLLLDVYQPQGDTATARPLFIWIHGGGFSGGAKTDLDIIALCQVFARKGYVTVSPAYRLEPSGRLNTALAMTTETLRALQDIKAAVRYLRAHKTEFKIDDTRILLGGTSAGGVLSLLFAYWDPEEIPDAVDVAANGSIEGSSGTPGVSSAISGIVNCWGGVGDSTWLNNAKLPAISFHGTADPTVPYDKGYSLGNPKLVTFGSACVHRGLLRAGVKSVLKPFVGAGHGVGVASPQADTLVNMTRDFAYEVLFGGGAGVVRRNFGAGVGGGKRGGLWRGLWERGGRFFGVDGRVWE